MYAPLCLRSAVDVFEAGLDPIARPGLRARSIDGTVRELPVARWSGRADAVDRRALAGLRGPVLDIGCGPGRHLRALGERGVPAMGIDVSPLAVALARRRGGRVHHGSVFGTVPRSGEWAAALLFDGNIGIGGDARRLLRRVGELLVPGGRLLVELAAPGEAPPVGRIRLESASLRSDWFSWATVSAAEIDGLAAATGFVVTERFADDGRTFVIATSEPHPGPRRGHERGRGQGAGEPWADGRSRTGPAPAERP